MKSEKPFQLPPAHQTFGKGDNSMSYRPFCIYTSRFRLFVLTIGTKTCATYTFLYRKRAHRKLLAIHNLAAS